MADVEAIRGTNGLTMVSTFSGCGGACLGYELAGFDLLWANEFVEEARTTYAANHPHVHLDGRDIRKVSGAEILETIGLKRGELDLLEGSPPCASFSRAGSKEKGWGVVKKYSDTEQRADDLFFEFSRLVDEIQPRVFVAENVAGLVQGKAIGYFKLILSELKSKGYEVTAKVLDASWLGVPQARHRLIFIGVRNDLVAQGIRPAYPKPFAYRYSMADVIDSTSPTAKPTTVDPETGESISLEGYAVGEEYDKLPLGVKSDKYFQLIRPRPDKPVHTITATGGQVGAAAVVHPTQKRTFTLEEVRRLSSFPADFVLTGSYRQRYERIGRSVPPLMAKAIGDVIRDEILRPSYGER
jgi:DNA (cytosine-5)-methyltransferase 1